MRQIKPYSRSYKNKRGLWVEVFLRCGIYFINLTDNKLPFLIDEFECRGFTWDNVISNSCLLTVDGYGLLIDAVDSPKLIEVVSVLDDLTVIMIAYHMQFESDSGNSI